MRRRHRATLYRRSGAVSKDSRGRKTTAWESLANDFACDFEPGMGRLVPGPDGQDVQVAGTLFVPPSELPASLDAAPGDAVVLTSARAARTTYLVHESRPQGERPERWDDELLLVHTGETIP